MSRNLKFSVKSMIKIVLYLIILLSWSIVYADDTKPIDSTPPVELDTTINDSILIAGDTADTLIALPAKDTILYIQSNTMDQYTLANDTTNYEARLLQNPTKALFKSMFIPGWGQYGNKKYYKAAFYFVLDVWLIGNAIKYGGEASDYFKQYENDTTIAGRNAFYEKYENKKDSRNKYTWFAVIVSFISMFDAYVDAHLSGFPEKKRFGDLDIDVHYDPEGGVKAEFLLPFNP